MKNSGVFTQCQNDAMEAIYAILSLELLGGYGEEVRFIAARKELSKLIRILGRNTEISVKNYCFEQIFISKDDRAKLRKVRFELGILSDKKPLIVELILQSINSINDEDENDPPLKWFLWKVVFFPSEEHDAFFGGPASAWNFPKEYEVMRSF